MTNPIYQCPHCKEWVEIELTKQGELELHKGENVKDGL